MRNYVVYRDGDSIATPSDAFYVDTGVEYNAQYAYQVSAVDDDGNRSPLSDEVTVIVLIRVWLPNNSGDTGEEVRVPINVSNARGIGASGIYIDFRYDAGLVQSARVAPTAISGAISYLANTATPGQVIISAVNAEGTINGEGTLFDVYLTLNSEGGNECNTMELDSVLFFDEDGGELDTDHSDTGTLCLGTGQTLGDLNENRMLDPGDVIYSLKLAVKLEDPADWMDVGDVNGDRVLDSADSVMIHRMSAGLSINPESPAEAKRLVARLKQTQPNVEASTRWGEPGTTVSVPILVADAADLSACDLTISHPSELTLESSGSVRIGALWPSGSNSEVNTTGKNVVRVAFTTEHPIEDATGVLVTLDFLVDADAELGTELAVKMSEVKLKGQYGQSFDWYAQIDKTDGNITVGAEGEGEGEGEGEPPSCCGGTTKHRPGGAFPGGDLMLVLSATATLLLARGKARAPADPH